MSFKVQIHNIKNATDKEKAKWKEVAELLAFELNNELFWTKLWLAWDTMTDKPKVMHRNYTKNLTFTEFKNMVLSGADKFNTEVDNDLDLYVTMYKSFKNTVGYTYPGTWWTWCNRKFFSRFNAGEIGGHCLHEYLHNMGFNHRGADRKSMVYQAGYIMRDCINARLGLAVKIEKKIKLTFLGKIKRFFERLF